MTEDNKKVWLWTGGIFAALIVVLLILWGVGVLGTAPAS